MWCVRISIIRQQIRQVALDNLKAVFYCIGPIGPILV